ncbi:MAG: glycosyltransferase [Pseudonocardiales bacterium]|nr:glycosyltransferase [Pseudonocardiales bacterium]MBV9729189.1 glycosyltransferase [Pseudonocardiales bacterium]
MIEAREGDQLRRGRGRARFAVGQLDASGALRVLQSPSDDPPSSPILDIDVIIPAFNEETRLPSTLMQTIDFLATKEWSSRVVVVDNGSADNTIEMVHRVAAGLSSAVDVVVVGCSRPGKGAAVRRGLLSSTARYVGFFDADLATPVETLDVTFRHLQRGAAAVIASRHMPGSTFLRRQPLVRRAGGAVFRLLTHSLVDGVWDTQCGFKFFERRAVQRALVECRTSGFAFDVELLQRLQHDGGRIVEVPVAWTDDGRSTFHPVRDGIAAFDAVLQMQRIRFP